MAQSLIIFAKNLVHGRVKTRLAAGIGNEAALDIYKELLNHTQAVTRALPVLKTVFYSDFIEASDIWEAHGYQKQLQQGVDLGERMSNAFRYCFRNGRNETAIIGTDCFELTEARICEAFAHLKSNDIIIGPARDGGYYLLAMKQFHPELFENISWSTDQVFNQTLLVCNNLNLSVGLLPVLADIDQEEDLKRFQDQSRAI